VSSDHFRLCIHLDEQGRPCNRRTTKPLTLCGLHRPKPKGGHSRTNEAQRQAVRRFKKRTTAGLPAGWEGI
jgi:hypothetical protein